MCVSGGHKAASLPHLIWTFTGHFLDVLPGVPQITPRFRTKQYRHQMHHLLAIAWLIWSFSVAAGGSAGAGRRAQEWITGGVAVAYGADKGDSATKSPSCLLGWCFTNVSNSLCG